MNIETLIPVAYVTYSLGCPGGTYTESVVCDGVTHRGVVSNMTAMDVPRPYVAPECDCESTRPSAIALRRWLAGRVVAIRTTSSGVGVWTEYRWEMVRPGSSPHAWGEWVQTQRECRDFDYAGCQWVGSRQWHTTADAAKAAHKEGIRLFGDAYKKTFHGRVPDSAFRTVPHDPASPRG